MALTDIIKNTLKIGSLAFLLNINFNSCDVFDSKEILIKNYLAALMDKDLDKMKSYMTSRRASKYYASDYGLDVLKRVYEGYRSIESYIPQEGQDKPNVYWIILKNGKYAGVYLVDEDGWKIDDIIGPR